MASSSGPPGAGAALSIVLWPEASGWRARLRAGRLAGGPAVTTATGDAAELLRLVAQFVDCAAVEALPDWPAASR
jgi:hypothetical protein